MLTWGSCRMSHWTYSSFLPTEPASCVNSSLELVKRSSLREAIITLHPKRCTFSLQNASYNALSQHSSLWWSRCAVVCSCSIYCALACFSTRWYALVCALISTGTSTGARWQCQTGSDPPHLWLGQFSYFDYSYTNGGIWDVDPPLQQNFSILTNPGRSKLLWTIPGKSLVGAPVQGWVYNRLRNRRTLCVLYSVVIKRSCTL